MAHPEIPKSQTGGKVVDITTMSTLRRGAKLNLETHTTSDAPFNSFAKQHEPTCLPNTRVDLLQNVYTWADGRDERCIFWLSGLVGTGKSTIARTATRRYFDQKRLGASFFFSRGGGDVGHAGKFATSIALQLASSIPSLDRHMCDALIARRDIASQSLRDQWQQLVLHPLSKLSQNGTQSSHILVVDALDECDNDDDILTIIHLFAEARSVRLRVFLTSRPDIPVRYGFGQMTNDRHQDFMLYNVSPEIIDNDIFIFFEYKLKLTREKNCLDTCWPGKQIVKQLVHNANGLFIWAATVCRFIDEGRSFAPDRLSKILRADPVDDSSDGFTSGDSAADNNDDSAVAPEQHLDEFYITVLRNSVQKYKKPERKKWRKLLGTTMGAVAVLSSRLSTQSLSRLLDTKPNVMDQTLNDLHAILEVPEDPTDPLRLHYPSFRDFLLNKKRYEDLHLGITEKQAHENLTINCVRLMRDSLKQDILDVDRLGAL
ncbi:hypothetical protein DL95DRAFT_417048 [Leptodontidium sp. 2 PMI_412]|nr:hypothetical protein DL95DRAFT_417048 [Leptodontidium sp. 2 PMI_412]